MKYSQFYAPTKRNLAKTDSINAYLLVKAGYITQIAAGAYGLLPLGLRSIRKIEEVIRQEMNALGASEVLLTALQPRQTWEQSGRWQDESFKQIVYQDVESGMTFGATHEEPMTILVKEVAQSYRDLPVLLYQFQTKFRKELRAKSGLLRGREFRMKDLYSFHIDNSSHEEFYEKVAVAYTKVFTRLGLESYRIKAAGGVFTKEFSDEFQVVCPTGEDEILVNHQTHVGYNKEVEDQVPESDKAGLERVRSIEVGNIFHLGSKYSDAFGLSVSNSDGVLQKVIMGSYGIGVTRLLGTLAELYNDENGLKLPKEVAPFQIQLIDLTNSEEGEKLYGELEKVGYEVLYDDRDVNTGSKLVEADLIGAPIRIVYSPKTSEHGSVELKIRATNEISLIKTDDLLRKLEVLLKS